MLKEISLGSTQQVYDWLMYYIRREKIQNKISSFNLKLRSLSGKMKEKENNKSPFKCLF